MKISNPLRDKTVNNITVGILVGYSTVTTISYISSLVAVSGPGQDFWFRTIGAWIVSLVVAWLISLMAKKS